VAPTQTSTEVIKIMAENLGLNPEDIDRNSTLKEELGLSPIELNDLLGHLSVKFDIIFNPQDAENLQKVEDLISLVEDNLLD